MANISITIAKIIVFNMIIGLILAGGLNQTATSTSDELISGALGRTTLQGAISENGTSANIETMKDSLSNPAEEERGFFQQVWDTGVQALEGAINVFKFAVWLAYILILGFANSLAIFSVDFNGPWILIILERILSLISLSINIAFGIEIYKLIINKANN